MKRQLNQLALLAALTTAVPGLAAAHGPKVCQVNTLHGQYIFSAAGHTRANVDSPRVPKAIIRLEEEQLFAPLHLAEAETIDKVIVHHPDRLHVGVDHGGAHETESAFLQVLAERLGRR